MEWKGWQDFTIDELYEVLQLRSEVFVVEQACVYEDLDDVDQKAYHLLVREGKELIGYLRVFFPEKDRICIGRVVVKKSHRRQGVATKLLKESLRWSRKHRKEKMVELSAQVYAMDLYKNLGFQEIGQVYQEDGIDHIKMRVHLS